jgi:4-amino-4-deoxy-L-arabinose transferase-like glycosyltransferase
MGWLSAVLRDFHFWIGTAAGLLGALFLAWENRRHSSFRQARERDAYLRKYLGY